MSSVYLIAHIFGVVNCLTQEMWWCNEVECLAQFNVMKKDCDNDIIEDFVHCESPNCHVLYWKDKNGAVCEDCFINVCEGCAADDDLAALLYGEDFFCRDCLKCRVNNGEIDYCQNSLKECKNFVYIKDNEAKILCLQCDLSYCDDCRSESLVKNICKSCRLRRKKNM